MKKQRPMKRLMLFFVLCTAVFCFSCKPINGPDPDKEPIDTDSTFIADPSLLFGEWSYKVNGETDVEINDSLIIEYHDNSIVHKNRYTIQGATLHIERLHFAVTDSCCRYETCPCRLVDDTLYIENFKVVPIGVFHPIYKEAKLIRRNN